MKTVLEQMNGDLDKLLKDLKENPPMSSEDRARAEDAGRRLTHGFEVIDNTIVAEELENMSATRRAWAEKFIADRAAVEKNLLTMFGVVPLVVLPRTYLKKLTDACGVFWLDPDADGRVGMAVDATMIAPIAPPADQTPVFQKTHTKAAAIIAIGTIIALAIAVTVYLKYSLITAAIIWWIELLLYVALMLVDPIMEINSNKRFNAAAIKMAKEKVPNQIIAEKRSLLNPVDLFSSSEVRATATAALKRTFGVMSHLQVMQTLFPDMSYSKEHGRIKIAMPMPPPNIQALLLKMRTAKLEILVDPGAVGFVELPHIAIIEHEVAKGARISEARRAAQEAAAAAAAAAALALEARRAAEQLAWLQRDPIITYTDPAHPELIAILGFFGQFELEQQVIDGALAEAQRTLF